LGSAVFGTSSRMNFNPIVIIGPSGAGKSSIVNVLCEKYDFRLIKTYTTRQQRDPSDTDHVFISLNEFQALVDKKYFFGTLDIFGSHYGLPNFETTKNTIILLRAPAVDEFLLKFPDAIIVEIDAPLKVLEGRLKHRGSTERFVPEALKKEMAWGRDIATITFNSSLQETEAIADTIAARYK
jgi:guanylate kinase